MDRKQMVQQYKQIKPQMGVFAFKHVASGKVYFGISQNIKADINSVKFQLNWGNYNKNINLQESWKKQGESGFEITTVEILKYDDDALKTDYTKDLEILRELCVGQFAEFELLN